MAKMTAKTVVKRGRNVFMVRPKDIKIQKGYNPREDFDTDMEELTNSIIENGLLNPITIKAGKTGELLLLNGERRLRACLTAIKKGHKLPEIPAFKERSSITDAESLVISFIANDGLRFSPIEEASAFKKMMVCGMTTVTIGTKIGRSDQYVRDRLVLLDGEPELKEAIQKKKIPTTLAKNIIKKTGKNKKLQKDLTREAASGKSGRRNVGAVLKKKILPKKAVTFTAAETFSRKDLLSCFRTEVKLFLFMVKKPSKNYLEKSVQYGKVMVLGQLLEENFDKATDAYAHDVLAKMTKKA